MKILFISSGNLNGKPGTVVHNQAQSLIDAGLNVSFFLIEGRGVWGYLKNIKRLKTKLKEEHYDLIHAHGLACFVATLTYTKPIVVSLLGSEVIENKILHPIFKLLSRYYWNSTIVKTKELSQILNGAKNSKLIIIPNGVNTQKFKPLNKIECREKLCISQEKKTVLFLADPKRKSKNYILAENALALLTNKNVEMKVFYNIPNDQVPEVINSGDVVLLTSLWEGSPNIVKEAMACNVAVVSTKVGDVELLFGSERGYFISSFKPEDIADKIELALKLIEEGYKLNGRSRLIELGLDSNSIANKIKSIYINTLESANKNRSSNY